MADCLLFSPVNTDDHSSSVVLSVIADTFSCDTDAIRLSLQPLYDTPFEVNKRCPKHFVLLLNGREDSVSIDHIKMAFLDTDTILTDDKPSTNAKRVRFASALLTDGA